MNLLVLGGGGFLGYHVVAEATSAGHTVTTFNREGKSEIDGVEALQGDRQGDLSALEGRTWDAVLDTFSDPDAVTRTAKLLSNKVGAYGYISGISNYHPEGPDVVDEDAPLRYDDGRDDPLQKRSLKKLACERALGEHFSGDLLIARVGIMVGPRDPTDRFTWWPMRFLRALQAGKTRVLAPGDPRRAVQFTDARDLAAWLVRSLDKSLTGTYNTVGPGREERIEDVLVACLKAAQEVAETSDADAELVWAEEDLLRDLLSDVEEEARPLWFPEDQIPFDKVDSTKALAHGLRFRSTYDTAKETLLWRQGQDNDLQAGFSPDLEAQLLSRVEG